jgi:hypothetical protein
MESSKKDLSRKKFIGWTIGIASVLTLPAFLRPPKKRSPSQTVKMLTQDGKLVEIDVSNIPDKKKKVSAADIHSWIRKKSSSL